MGGWVLSGVLIILAALPAPGVGNRLTLYNTTGVCFFSASQALEIDCRSHTQPHFSFVYVHRVFYGVTPLSGNCSATSPTLEQCCPQPVDVTDQDCVVASEEEAAKWRRKCDGLLSCSTSSMDLISLGEGCWNTTSVQVFHFAFVEYGCVEDDLLMDVCDYNVTQTGDALFLESNFYADDEDHSNKTCSCDIRTECQQALVLELLEVDLNTNPSDGDTCTETVEVTEGDSGTVLTHLNCTSGLLASLNRQGGEGGVVQSVSSVVTVHLHLAASHTGKLLLRVTATDGGPVEVWCGRPDEQTSWNLTQCIASPATTTTVSPPEDLSSPVYNSSDQACLHGAESFADVFTIECPDNQGLISVERVFHGLTPEALNCHASASKESCCPGFDPSRDCLFATEEGVTAVRQSCDGHVTCSPKLERASVPSGACPDHDNITYGDYSSFAFVEYSCINIGLVSDICDAGNTIRKSEVYLERNVHHFDSDVVTPTCSCVVSTACGQQLLFYAMLLELSSTAGEGGSADVCLEQVILEDVDNSSVRVTLDCTSNEIDEVPTKNRNVIFQSQSNVVNFQLHRPLNNAGEMLFKIVATEEAEVEVRCGRTTALPLWKEHQCIPIDNTTDATAPTISTTTSAWTGPASTPPGSAENTTDGQEGEEESEDDRETIIVIVAVVVAVIVVIAFIIVIVVIVWRSKKTNSEHVAGGGGEEYSVYYEPAPDPATDDYDTLVPPSGTTHTYDTWVPPATADSEKQGPPPGLHGNGDVHHEGPTGEGAVGGVDNPAYDNSYHLQNILNEASPRVGSVVKREKF